MNPQEQFYQAFERMDVDAMVALYADEIIFEDPAFGKLEGECAKNMWRMLVGSQKSENFKVSFRDLDAGQGKSSCMWEANYTFPATGRKVFNVIQSEMHFRDGKILQHTDVFDFYRWTKEALGTKGKLLGWMPWFQRAFQKRTHEMLNRFEKKLG